MKISVLIPIYIPSTKHIEMTRKCIDLAKTNCDYDNVEWVIVETCSDHFIDDADIFVYEKEKTKPNTSINRGFRACSGDYIVFLSNDVFVGDGWLSSLISCFNIDDCGLATLGTKEHRDEKKDLIEESIYFPIAMIPKEDAWFDSFYKNCWDDTDLIMRVYSKGKKMYKNYNSIVEHLNRQTQEPNGTYDDEYNKCKQYFLDKWKEYSNMEIYGKLS